MSVQEFLTSGTWDWPTNTVHCTALVLSQGGGGHALQGGGGTGGILVAKEIYKASSGASPLTITVGNSGGAAGTNGADSKIIQNGSTEILSKGGKGATSSTGAVNSSIGCIGALVILGGDGGTGAFGRGGGGGAAPPFSLTSSSDPADWIGHNAPTPDAPSGDMLGGNSSGTGHGTDDGGKGADSGENGQNGHNYGGGGGGGGVVAGRGGDARVAILWGLGLGATTFSVGKCCSICDIATKFPSSVSLTLDMTPVTGSTCYGSLSIPVTLPDRDVDIGIGCDNETQTITFPGFSSNSAVENNEIIPVFLHISGTQLEQSSFLSDRGAVSTEQGTLPAWFCRGVYSCPLASASIDNDAASSAQSFLAESDRWCFLGSHPSGTQTSPTVTSLTDDCGTASNTCSQTWLGVWGRCAAVLSLYVTAGQKWYAQVSVDLVFRSKRTVGNCTLPSSVPGQGVNDTDWVKIGLGQVTAASSVLGPYDTSDEALNAVKGLTLNAGSRCGSYSPLTIGPAVVVGAVAEWVEVTGGVVCEAFGCQISGVAAGQAAFPAEQVWATDPVTTGISW